MEELKLHPMYAAEYWKLVAFFEDDPTIKVGPIKQEDKSVTITCEDALKASYLRKILNPIELVVNVECDELNDVCEEMIDYVCKDNPLYSGLVENGLFKACMFKPICTHYFSDDMFSPTGHTAITARDLAKAVLDNKINYQTDFLDD